MILLKATDTGEARVPARSPPPRSRFDALDAARGAALVAMIAYHTVWDLGYLRLTPENYALTPAGKAAAHVIAGTFLFLVGVGLVLMNGDGIRWRPFLLRLGRIAGAACLITVATWFAFPQAYIFFGILHCIAASSVLALPFLALPVAVPIAGAVLLIVAPHFVGGPLFESPLLTFVGLGSRVPPTNDYVPLFPWFGAVLAGLAATRLALPVISGSKIGTRRSMGRVGSAAARAGRHSLAIYLVHQPLLLALLTGLATLTGPHPRAGLAAFRMEYQANCGRTGGDPEACRIASRCVSQALQREGLWAMTERSFTVAERARAQALSQSCYEASEGTAPVP